MDEPKIIDIGPILVVGMRIKLKAGEIGEKTSLLWRSFGPRIGEIKNRANSDRLSIQVYPSGVSFVNFTPQTEFVKWAAVEVSDASEVPPEMESFTLTGGKYAVFIHRGLPSAFPQTATHIFNNWMPESGFATDTREHFERMAVDYSAFDADAEEEIWIPIVPRYE